MAPANICNLIEAIICRRNYHELGTGKPLSIMKCKWIHKAGCRLFEMICRFIEFREK